MLEKANHPVAKALLVLIREDPTIDEEAERMAKRCVSFTRATPPLACADG